jgi:fermentation-respiration switch protein FrsA (DUF1100 family)
MMWLAPTLLAVYMLVIVRRALVARRGERWRVFRKGLAITILAYLAIMLMLMFLENKLLYFPLTSEEHWEAPTGSEIEEVWLTSSEGDRLHGWWFPHRSAEGCVLYSHGNGGNLSHRQGYCRAWQELGASVLIYDYPGYGRSSGRPSESGCHAAAQAAYSWLRDVQNVAPDKLILFGESLGCAMAVDLAMTHPHRALVLYAPFTSVRDMAQCMFPWLPVRWLVRTRYDNLAKIQQYTGPLFLAHGTNDSVVPFQFGQRLFEAAPKGTCNRFLPVTGCDHNNGLTKEVFDGIGKFLLNLPNLPLPQPVSRPS